MKALVIGSGVSGLSAGIRLLEAGIATQIWSREPAAETTSAVAAAFWYPYKVFPENLVLGWAAITYNELTRLASVNGTGVMVQETVELLAQPAAYPCLRHRWRKCLFTWPIWSGDLLAWAVRSL